MVKPRRSTENEHEDQLTAFQSVCRNTGIKVTPQRLEIFRALLDSDDHPSAEEVHARVRSRLPTISLDTVYRTLTTLEEHGVLTRVKLDTRVRYDPNLLEHHHFVCIECKTIEDFYWPAFDRMRLPPGSGAWGRIRTRHVEIRGHCRDCLRKREKAKREEG